MYVCMHVDESSLQAASHSLSRYRVFIGKNEKITGCLKGGGEAFVCRPTGHPDSVVPYNNYALLHMHPGRIVLPPPACRRATK